jgi:hypothetical protein
VGLVRTYQFVQLSGKSSVRQRTDKARQLCLATSAGLEKGTGPIAAARRTGHALKVIANRERSQAYNAEQRFVQAQAHQSDRLDDKSDG